MTVVVGNTFGAVVAEKEGSRGLAIITYLITLFNHLAAARTEQLSLLRLDLLADLFHCLHGRQTWLRLLSPGKEMSRKVDELVLPVAVLT